MAQNVDSKVVDAVVHILRIKQWQNLKECCMSIFGAIRVTRKGKLREEAVEGEKSSKSITPEWSLFFILKDFTTSYIHISYM